MTTTANGSVFTATPRTLAGSEIHAKLGIQEIKIGQNEPDGCKTVYLKVMQSAWTSPVVQFRCPIGIANDLPEMYFNSLRFEIVHCPAGLIYKKVFINDVEYEIEHRS